MTLTTRQDSGTATGAMGWICLGGIGKPGSWHLGSLWPNNWLPVARLPDSRSLLLLICHPLFFSCWVALAASILYSKVGVVARLFLPSYFLLPISYL